MYVPWILMKVLIWEVATSHWSYRRARWPGSSVGHQGPRVRLYTSVPGENTDGSGSEHWTSEKRKLSIEETVMENRKDNIKQILNYLKNISTRQ